MHFVLSLLASAAVGLPAAPAGAPPLAVAASKTHASNAVSVKMSGTCGTGKEAHRCYMKAISDRSRAYSLLTVGASARKIYWDLASDGQTAAYRRDGCWQPLAPSDASLTLGDEGAAAHQLIASAAAPYLLSAKRSNRRLVAVVRKQGRATFSLDGLGRISRIQIDDRATGKVTITARYPWGALPVTPAPACI